jgi:hypothetical protein
VSLKEDILRAARRAQTSLGSAAGLVTAFVRTQADPGGGFRDRSGKADLYYTVFGLQCALALGDAPPAATAGYLRSFADPRALDLVHATCLARAWALVQPEGAPAEVRRAILDRLQDFRAADGGFNTVTGAASGSAYGAFLALGAFQDLGGEVPDPVALAASVGSLRMVDGGYTNDHTLPLSSTPAAVACLTVLCELGESPMPETVAYLMARADPSGVWRPLSRPSPIFSRPQQAFTHSGARARRSTKRRAWRAPGSWPAWPRNRAASAATPPTRSPIANTRSTASWPSDI